MRCFIALPLSEAVKDACESAIAALQPVAPPTKWTARDKMHLTLKFLGNVPREDLGRLERGLTRAAAERVAFTLRTGPLGVFHRSRRPRVLWLGLDGAVDMLVQLHAAVEGVCEGIGVARETRPFAPHLTLGRVKAGSKRVAPDWLDAIPSPDPVSWCADEVRLFESQLHPSGAIHKTLAICSLVTYSSTARPDNGA